MTIRKTSATAAIATLLLAASTSASEPLHDPVGFGAGQGIPGTLTLNFSETGRNARITPVYSKYRPKVVFDGREVICMVRFAPGLKAIAPGESGEVRLECKEPVSVARANSRLTVREGGKDVGHVDVRLPE